MIPEPLTVFTMLALIVASYFTSAITAALGVGGGVALMVFMLYLLPPTIVLPVHGVVQAGSNLGRGFVLRKHIDRRMVIFFAAGSVAGVALASVLFVALPTRLLSLFLALFILWTLWVPKFKVTTIPLPGFIAVGAVASFLTMFVGATGPVVAVFLNVAQLGRMAVVASHATMMVVQHTFKVLAFGLIGFAFGSWLPLMVLMIVSGYLGTLSGKRILDKLPENRFAQLFKVVLTILALRLLWSAATQVEQP